MTRATMMATALLLSVLHSAEAGNGRFKIPGAMSNHNQLAPLHSNGAINTGGLRLYPADVRVPAGIIAPAKPTRDQAMPRTRGHGGSD